MALADTITGRGQPYVRRRRRETRARWFAARARNALRRPFRLATLGGVIFLAALVTLIVVPRDARRRASRLAPHAEEWRDTTALLAAAASSRQALARADSALGLARLAASRPSAAAAAAPLTPQQAARRDSLVALDATLAALLARVENAPLPATYRALGESPVMRGDARVRVLLDSLADVERERDEFGSSGGVDPIFVSLSARATAIGRSIEAIADARLASARGQLAALRADSLRDAPPAAPMIDTLPLAQQRDSAARHAGAAARALARVRVTNAALDQRLAAAREQANIVAPPIAILFAALVLGLTLGFALTLLQEIRLPRVADLAETEFVTGSRVLAVLRPRQIPPERSRRKADRGLPPLLDPTADPYRLLASHLSVAGDEPEPGAARVIPRAGAAGALVAVVGDDADVAAVIAANIAAASANDTRGTLLVDADVERRAVARVFHVDASPALRDVLLGRAEWAAATRSVVVGRDRALDVLPSDGAAREALDAREGDALRRSLARATRRYDLVLAHVPIEAAAALPFRGDVLICAHLAHTPLLALKHHVAALRESGARVIGLVLWSADHPHIPS